MKIKTSLTLLTLIFTGLITTIGFIIFLTFGLINRELMRYDDVNELSKCTSELSIVTHEYLMHHEEKMLQQWRLKYDSIAGMLEKIKVKEPHPEHLSILESITSDYKILGDLFSQIQTDFAKRKRLIEENIPPQENDIAPILEEREMSHALMRTQKIRSRVFEFSAMIQKHVKGVHRRAGLIILFSIIGFIILSFYISFLVIRGITRPLYDLVKGTEIIGKGKLNHKVGIETKNEIGGLAVAFNEMTENLGKVTASRDELNAANQQLQASEQQLRASNQQLKANEQQLRSESAERKETEGKLLHAAKEWRITFDSISDLVSLHAADYKLMRVNMPFAKVAKAHPKELIGRNCYEVVHGTTEPQPDCPHKKAIETRKPTRGEYFEPHLGIHMEVSVSPILNKKGELIATVHIAKDITERKKAEDETKKHLHELEVFYKANINREGRIMELKEKVEKLKGKIGKGSV